jgi:hypothetical protein
MTAPTTRSLWARAPAWRALFVIAVLLTLLVGIGQPWREGPWVDQNVAANYVPILPPAPPTPPLSEPVKDPALQKFAALPQGVNGMQRVPGPDRVPAPAPSPVAGQAPDAAVYEPPARSTVVWNSETSSVSGGGLIASYCCIGPDSQVFANKRVSSGRHYWELTLSVGATQQAAGATTNAGVTSISDKEIREGARALLSVTDRRLEDRAVWAFGVAQQNDVRSGDTLMFALDANRGFVNIGLNGQWRTGDPANEAGLTVGKYGSTYIPYAVMSSGRRSGEGDRWIANFGGSRFRYPIPVGYGAYGTQTVVPQPTSGAHASDQSEASVFMSGKHYGAVTVGGRKVPIPDGEWLPLAYEDRSPEGQEGDVAVLAQVESRTVPRLIVLHAHRGGSGPYPEFLSCRRTDYVFLDEKPRAPGASEACWWINHTTNIWRDHGVMDQARARVLYLTRSPADVWVNVGFRRVDCDGFVNALYYFDPRAENISSGREEWLYSPWHSFLIKSDKPRQSFVEARRVWGEEWARVWFAFR